MLVLSREVGEPILIGDGVKLTAIAIHIGRVPFRLAAPLDILAHCEELTQTLTINLSPLPER